jgi:hypothetical protein
MKTEFTKSGSVEKAHESRINRKFQTLGAAVALFSTLTFGGLNFSGIGPKTARAETVEIERVKVEKGTLTNTIANLRKESTKYAWGEGDARNTGTYSAGLRIPDELIAVFSMDSTTRMSIVFPKGDPNGPWEGKWGTVSTEFAGLVKKLTGKEMKRVVMVLEKTKSDDGIQPIINVYAIPADVDGNIIGKYNGGQIAFGVSYYPNARASGEAVGGAICVLSEPAGPIAHVAHK